MQNSKVDVKSEQNSLAPDLSQYSASANKLVTNWKGLVDEFFDEGFPKLVSFPEGRDYLVAKIKQQLSTKITERLPGDPAPLLKLILEKIAPLVSKQESNKETPAKMDLWDKVMTDNFFIQLPLLVNKNKEGLKYVRAKGMQILSLVMSIVPNALLLASLVGIKPETIAIPSPTEILLANGTFSQGSSTVIGVLPATASTMNSTTTSVVLSALSENNPSNINGLGTVASQFSNSSSFLQSNSTETKKSNER